MWLRDTLSSVLHLLEELVGWVLVAVLLHLGQVALLGSDGGIHLVVRKQLGGRRGTQRRSLLVTNLNTF